MAWDLAPHDISIILHILGESPAVVNCQGNAHVTPGIEDVTNMSLNFAGQALRHHPEQLARAAQGARDDHRRHPADDRLRRPPAAEKIRIYDVRVERPPHYDTFAEFQYSYHYGDSYIPHLNQEEPLKVECQHFLDCIRKQTRPMTCGARGLELVRILEASSESLKASGAPVKFSAVPDQPNAAAASSQFKASAAAAKG